MSTIASICGARTFGVREAKELLPVVRRITSHISSKADLLIDQLERMDVKDVEKTSLVEEQLNLLILKWQQKLKKLGVQPRGLWFADFPSEQGAFTWKYPESFLDFQEKKADVSLQPVVLRKPETFFVPVTDVGHIQDSL